MDVKKYVAELNACETDAERMAYIDSIEDKDVVDAMLKEMDIMGKGPIDECEESGKSLIFSVINLQRKYETNFALTATAAFLFRMADEYGLGDLPEGLIPDDLISEEDPKFTEPFYEKLKELAQTKPIEILEKEIEALSPDAPDYAATKKVLEKKLILQKKHIYSGKKKDAEETIKDSSEIIKEVKELLELDAKKEAEYRANYAYLAEKPGSQWYRETERFEKNKSDYTAKLELHQKKLDIAKKTKVLMNSNLIMLKGKDTTGVKFEMYNLTDDDYEEAGNHAKKVLGISETREDHIDKYKSVIVSFLEKYLQYNPDLHVRSRHAPGYQKFISDKKYKMFDVMEGDKKARDAVVPKDIPVVPADTFCRLRRYVDANYEPLRQATDDIFCEKEIFAYAIRPYRVLEGTPEERKESYERFKKDVSGVAMADIYDVNFGAWTILESFDKNREKYDYYGPKTELMKEIIEQNEKDEKDSFELVKERIKKNRDKTSKGPDTKRYASPVAGYGLEKVPEGEEPKGNQILPIQSFKNRVIKYGKRRRVITEHSSVKTLLHEDAE